METFWLKKYIIFFLRQCYHSELGMLIKQEAVVWNQIFGSSYQYSRAHKINPQILMNIASFWARIIHPTAFTERQNNATKKQICVDAMQWM